mmetsp:Transcript_40730/g.117960  ORF Transcript_40730/g.117960 Transcript_40730/m.117960 type:complete len:416 (-) Transcript_40730:34-1281(-)
MPLLCTKGAVSLATMVPQDFVTRRPNTRSVGKEVLARLADDLQELMVAAESINEILSPEKEYQTVTRKNSRAPTIASEQDHEHVHEISEDVHKQLGTILTLIQEMNGDTVEAVKGRPPSKETVELLELLISQNLLVQLLSQLAVLEFEARKDVMNVCCALLWPNLPKQLAKRAVQHLTEQPKIFKLLVDGYANEETALHYGVVLRSWSRHHELVEAFLDSGAVPELLRFAKGGKIDISSDAFYTLREMLLAHKEVSALWLEQNGLDFFASYNQLLVSGEYIAERQAQKLLKEMLLDKQFQKVMIEYVSDDRNLQIHMNLLKDRSKVIQMEAFHIFKIFVANPQKPLRVQHILFKNKGKLVSLLRALQGAKADDQKATDELRSIIDKLTNLPTPRSRSNVVPDKVAVPRSPTKISL